MICIIAGYADSLDKYFFSMNEGLKRRFPYRIRIKDYSSEQIKQIFLKKVREAPGIVLMILHFPISLKKIVIVSSIAVFVETLKCINVKQLILKELLIYLQSQLKNAN